MPSIIQPWVAALGLRHQGVLVSAVRGCDVSPKDCPVKRLSRYLRGCILVPHVGDIARASTFMSRPTQDEWRETVQGFFAEDWDMMPLHYVLHLAHASQILGYYHPDIDSVDYGWLRTAWREFYVKMCSKMHLNPETREQLDARLNADEATFKANQ